MVTVTLVPFMQYREPARFTVSSLGLYVVHIYSKCIDLIRLSLVGYR